MEQSSAKVPQVQPPRPEGISRRGVMMILLLVAIFYVANWISTRPLTRRSRFVTPVPAVPSRSGAPAPGPTAAGPTPAGPAWCTDFGGVWERFSPFIEICYFPPITNSSSSSKKRLKKSGVRFARFSKRDSASAVENLLP
jgi:hypothetical protein